MQTEVKTGLFRVYCLFVSVCSRRGHRGDAGDASHPTRPKEVLTWHLISLKLIAKNIFVLHIT